MKKLFFVALTIICSYATSFAQTKTPKAVETAFNAKFPKATKVKWVKENATEYEANFVLSNVKYSANYSITGEWLETESPTTFVKLPTKVQEAFNLAHKGEKIKVIAVIENAKGEKHYEFEVKKGLKSVEYFYNSDGKLVN